MKTHEPEFLKAHKKVLSGKKKLSDKEFIKFKKKKPNDLNSLGKFFYNKESSLAELKKISEDYNNKCYLIDKYICVILPKGSDDYRPILVPSPRDRILFSFILEKIKEPIFTEINNFNVFGSGKRLDYPNMKKILSSVYLEAKKHKYILKIDISKFFPSIDKESLFKELKKYIKDDYLLKLIDNSFNNTFEIKYTKNFSDEKKKEIEAFVKKGVPQGCAYSPLLANFYGLDMDKFVSSEGYTSFRYLDDMIIFTESEDKAKKIFERLKKTAEKINLKIHDIDSEKKNKIYIQKADHSFEYLGMEIKSDGSYEIPIYKIKKEINLIKNGIFNKKTINRFTAKKVVEVLTLQLNGWRSFYAKNFPSAYKSLQSKTFYNEQLKKYYSGIMFSNQSIKKDLKSAGFKIEDKKFYLF
ncbi:MAG TPA: reverse transcriptase/maturase family protein [Candidatus Paceibacterota bacterium]|nr:reverse transcriptase/maturase family protein [Candidatus Paceibacterota bacterium]